MSDALTIGSGRRTVVSVDDLLVDAHRLDTADAQLRGWLARLELVLLRSDDPGAPPEAETREAVAELASVVAAAAAQAGRLAWWLRVAGGGYGLVESEIAALWEFGGRVAAFALGAGAVLDPVRTAGVLGAAGLGALARSGFDPERLVSDPAFVRLVRTAVDHADDAVLAGTIAAIASAAIRQPPLVPVLAGLGALAATAVPLRGGGAPANAERVREAASATPRNRMLVETPVTVRRVAAETPTAAPTGFAQLASRVPADGAGGPQLRIERYGGGWIVYLGGTLDFGPLPEQEPWDLTSDVGLLAERSDASRASAVERAAKQALDEAGYRSGEPIVAVGHSAGGMAAARLAADPGLTVIGGLNLGGAVSAVDTPAGVPFVSVEHDDDLVPALAGHDRDDDPERVTVSRRALDGAAPADGGGLPAHALARYRETAALMDGSNDPRLARMLELVRETTAAGEGRSSRWRAERATG